MYSGRLSGQARPIEAATMGVRRQLRIRNILLVIVAFEAVAFFSVQLSTSS
jgi:hypothetical protein